ncbi:hypothetical protein Hte_009628 [Hypoxylon texense]
MMNRDYYSHGSLPDHRPTNRRMQPMAQRAARMQPMAQRAARMQPMAQRAVRMQPMAQPAPRMQPMARRTAPTNQTSQYSFVLGNRQEVFEDHPGHSDEGNSGYLYDPEEYGYDSYDEDAFYGVDGIVDDDYVDDYYDDGNYDDDDDDDDDFNTTLAHVRESMKPCCPECVSRRAEIVHMLLQANPGTINHVFALFELAERETLDELVALHPGTRLERHQFHYETDRVVYEDSLSSSEDFTSRFVVGPSPMPTLFVVEFDEARAAQLQRPAQPPPSNPPARAIQPGLVAQPRIAAEQGRTLALPAPPPPSNLPTRSLAPTRATPPTIQPAGHAAAPQVASSEHRRSRRGARGRGRRGNGQAPQGTQNVNVTPPSNSRQLTLRPASSRAAPQAAPQVNAQAPPPPTYRPGTTGLRPAAPKQTAAAPVAVPAAAPAAATPAAATPVAAAPVAATPAAAATSAPTTTTKQAAAPAGADAPALTAPATAPTAALQQAAASAGAAPPVAAPPVAGPDAAPKQAAAPAGAAPVAVPTATPSAAAPTQAAGAPAPALAAPATAPTAAPKQAAAPAGAAPPVAAPPVAAPDAALQQAAAPAAAATTQQATPAPENRDVPSLEKRKEVWDRTRGSNIPTLDKSEPYTWHLPDRQFNWKACVGGPRGMVQVVKNWTPQVRLFQRQWQPGENTRVTEFVLGPSDDRLWGSNAFEFMLNEIFDIMACYSHHLLKLDGDMDFASFFENWFGRFTSPTDETIASRMDTMTAINEGTKNIRTRNKRMYAEVRRILLPLIQRDPKEKEHVQKRLFEWVYGPKDAAWADVKEDGLIRLAQGVWIELAQSAGDTTTVAYINREFHRQSYAEAVRSQPGRQTHS